MGDEELRVASQQVEQGQRVPEPREAEQRQELVDDEAVLVERPAGAHPGAARPGDRNAVGTLRARSRVRRVAMRRPGWTALWAS